jgi:ATP-NAD kinase N-terminal domain
LKPVGIIPNPASGKDIRRLVAYGSVFDNNEKVNIVKRVILGLDSMGVEEVVFMPEYFGIGIRAMEDLNVSLAATFLEMKIDNTQEDSARAAEMMKDLGVACIVTLGGDGTNRVVANTCADTPLLPISTGTNNVFPYMVEGTLAGLAAGVTALNSNLQKDFTHRVSQMEIKRGSQLIDIALVDVVVSKPGFIASRALWDISTIKEIFLSRTLPGQIGFSAIGSHIPELSGVNGKGVHIIIGPGPQKVKAPIAPGIVSWVPVKSYRIFEPNEEVPFSHLPAMIALDGEREWIEGQDSKLTIRINQKGPLVIDIPRALQKASEQHLFLTQNCEEENDGIIK